MDAAATQRVRLLWIAIGSSGFAVAIAVVFVEYFPAFLALPVLIVIGFLGLIQWRREDGVRFVGTPPPGHSLAFKPVADLGKTSDAVKAGLYGFGFLAAGLLMIVEIGLAHPSGQAKCGNRLMSPQDICEYRRNGSLMGHTDYGTELTDATQFHPGAVVFGGALALIGISLIGFLLVNLRRSRASS